MASLSLVQALFGHMANFARSVGVDALPPRVAYRDDLGPGAFALPGGEIVLGSLYRPHVESLAARYGKRGRLTNEQVWALRGVLHELAHQRTFGRHPEFYDGSGSASEIEEAAAERWARDVLPIAALRLFGHRLPPNRRERDLLTRGYDDRAKWLGQLSVFGSGAKKMSDRAARAWTRQLLNSTPEERQRMVDAAMAARVAWGQRTGR